jgi:hypothetical protein
MPTDAGAVDLYWIPLGAGSSTGVVRTCGRAFEGMSALVERRACLDLYHSALEVRTGQVRFVVEMAPVWSIDAADRGVVAEGAVGLRWLGRSRAFRYEVRCWRDGVIPDASEAVESPQRLSADRVTAERVVSLCRDFPTATWGRDELRTGDMWNSNSLVSWLLASAGLDVRSVAVPAHGRAPGWTAGLLVAERDARHAARPAGDRWTSRLGA